MAREGEDWVAEAEADAEAEAENENFGVGVGVGIGIGIGMERGVKRGFGYGVCKNGERECQSRQDLGIPRVHFDDLLPFGSGRLKFVTLLLLFM